MKIHGDNQKKNIDQSLQPLFDAMASGKVISSITCMAGMVNKDNRDEDFIISDFVAQDYWIGMSSSGTTESDYVDIDNTDRGRNEVLKKQRIAFYMSWVLSYTIDERIIFSSNAANPKNYNCAARGSLDQCQYPDCVCHNTKVTYHL